MMSSGQNIVDSGTSQRDRRIFVDIEPIGPSIRQCNNENRADLFEQFEQMGDEMLISACETNNLSLITRFLDSGQDPNKYLKSGWTLLLYAASNAQVDLVQHLLDRGANPNLHKEGYTALLALCNSTKGSAVDRFQCLTCLIESKANANATNKVKETPLMYACKMQDTNFVLELLKHVSDVNFADGEGRTALFYAVADNRYDVVKILIDHGADIKCTNYRGLTAEDVAMTKGFEELFPLLEIPVDDAQEYVGTDHIISWMDMFPSLNQIDKSNLNNDIANLLYGMGLESYKSFFCELELKNFLRLEEEKLKALGMDLSVHRARFFDELLRFHKHEWSSTVMKSVDDEQFTLFDAVKILGNMNQQLIVMSSSACILRNQIDSSLNDEDKGKLAVEIEMMQHSLMKMKNRMNLMKGTATKIQNENSDLSLPVFIGPCNKSNKKWILMTLLTLTSIYFLRIEKMEKLWIGKNAGLVGWKNTINHLLSISIQKLNFIKKVM